MASWHNIARELTGPTRENAWQAARIAGGFRRPRHGRMTDGEAGSAARGPSAGSAALAWAKAALACPCRRGLEARGYHKIARG
ncbi:MAG: hypothetical protein GXO54_06465 [Chloroflexi bacterium]|nr:hypothetical protein [Chloroflexota bacterium]